jgi:hypothetical protein
MVCVASVPRICVEGTLLMREVLFKDTQLMRASVASLCVENYEFAQALR